MWKGVNDVIDTRAPEGGYRWHHSPLVAVEALHPDETPGWWHIQTAWDEPHGLWLSVSTTECGGDGHVPRVGDMVSWYGDPTYAIILAIGERVIYDHSHHHWVALQDAQDAQNAHLAQDVVQDVVKEGYFHGDRPRTAPHLSAPHADS